MKNILVIYLDAIKDWFRFVKRKIYKTIFIDFELSLILQQHIKFRCDHMIDYNNIKHTCSNCGKPVNKNSSKCPHCGVKLQGRVWKDGKNPFEEEYRYNLNKAQRRENTKNNLINLAINGVCCIITLFIALFGIIAGIFFLKKGEKKFGYFLIIFGAIMLIVRIFATLNGMPAHYILIFTPGYP